MPRKLGFRKGLRQQRLESIAGQSFYAAMMERGPRRDAAMERIEADRAAIKPVRERAARKPSGKPLERDVMKAIIKALRKHPNVARVDRNQSGAFTDGQRWLSVGSKGKADLTVYLRDGRYAEIEVKRPGGKVSEAQFKRMYAIRAAGGLAGIAESVEDAFSIIDDVAKALG